MHRGRMITAAGAMALAVVLCGAASAGAEQAPQVDWSGWHEGASGMMLAVKAYEEEHKPIFVYFYTTWCNFCRQFERVLLSDGVVDAYLDTVIRVRVDAEGGPEERRLSEMYGVRGYPTLMMHSGRTKTVSSVSRHEERNGKARLLEAEAFVRELKNAASR